MSAGPTFPDIVAELEAEIQDWLRDTPDFFHPTSRTKISSSTDFFDVPWIFKRQQRTVQASFFFANMLIYRGYLLQDFLNQMPSTPRSIPPSKHVRACVDNALSMVVLAAEWGGDECRYNATFWASYLKPPLSVLSADDRRRRS